MTVSRLQPLRDRLPLQSQAFLHFSPGEVQTKHTAKDELNSKEAHPETPLPSRTPPDVMVINILELTRVQPHVQAR